MRNEMRINVGGVEYPDWMDVTEESMASHPWRVYYNTLHIADGKSYYATHGVSCATEEQALRAIEIGLMNGLRSGYVRMIYFPLNVSTEILNPSR